MNSEYVCCGKLISFYIKGLRSLTHPLSFLESISPIHSVTSSKQRLWIDSFIKNNKKRLNASQTGQLNRPRDSFVVTYLRFKTDPSILDDYVNAYNTIRIGKILEDLDALAAAISFLHCGMNSLSVVTASLDRIDTKNRIPIDADVRMAGHVTFVGSSSLEVLILMDTCPDGAPEKEDFGYEASFTHARQPNSKRILSAKFTMVAMDFATNKPTKVPGLQLLTEEDNLLYELGAQSKLQKKTALEASPSRKAPRHDEMILIHDLFLESSALKKTQIPNSIVWMKDTTQQSLVVCMPQERNLNNKMFGGYLMRLAYELAHATGILFCKSTIGFVALDDISFKHPVNIGSILSLKSEVVYSDGGATKMFQVSVIADVIDPNGDQKTTNTFHFTFRAKNLKKNETLPKVMPQTYAESMRYIEGKRRKEKWFIEQIKEQH